MKRWSVLVILSILLYGLLISCGVSVRDLEESVEADVVEHYIEYWGSKVTVLKPLKLMKLSDTDYVGSLQIKRDSFLGILHVDLDVNVQTDGKMYRWDAEITKTNAINIEW